LPRKSKLIAVNTRLFADDVEAIKKLAGAARLPWQIELRQIVHRALTGERRDVVMLKERDS
jgi:predicted DNA binding CopG/RHH family protein